VTLKNGTVLDSGPLRFAKGHMRNPLSRQELFSKFRDCTKSALSEAASERLFERLQALERQPGAAAIYDAGA
jgi:2-methylcitrate dehydratase PrpD